jgi:hypothetical protein
MAPLGLIMAGACGGGGTPSSQVQGAVTAKIKTVLQAPPNNLNVNDVKVTCPPNAQAKEGATFQCQANIGGQVVPYNVVVTSGSHFEATQAKAVIPTTRAEGALKQQISAQLHVDANVNCGNQQLIVKSPGEIFDCQASAQGQTRTFHLTVTDVQGHVQVSG